MKKNSGLTHLDKKQKELAMVEYWKIAFDCVKRKELLRNLKKNKVERKIVKKIMQIYSER